MAGSLTKSGEQGAAPAFSSWNLPSAPGRHALPEGQGQALCAAFPDAACQVANNATESTAGC
jgi:hypothetical protein